MKRAILSILLSTVIIGGMFASTNVQAATVNTKADTKVISVRGDSRPILKRGSRGEVVVQLQRRLLDGGYFGRVKISEINKITDGVFGSKTEAAVKKFQSAYGIKADGIVGPKTWDALDAWYPQP